MSTKRYVYKEEPYSSHSLIINWLVKQPADTRVLDVGSATGMLGNSCAGKGLVFHGIEPQTEWAVEASPFYEKILTAKIEEIPDKELAGYSVVVLADVLEHMEDPQSILERLVRLQPETCIFVVSVPNIANIWVRLNLLFGRFEYQERGILDRTHLRFFTWHSFQSFLKSSGLEIQESQATPIPLSLVNPFFNKTRPGKIISQGLYLITRLFPTLLGYQFVVKASAR